MYRAVAPAKLKMQSISNTLPEALLIAFTGQCYPLYTLVGKGERQVYNSPPKTKPQRGCWGREIEENSIVKCD
jgi:hypothetical protein